MSQDFTGTMPVAERQQFDVTALEAYLVHHIEGYRGPLKVEQFKGGQSNPTFLLHTGHARYVLRKKPTGPLLPSAHAVDREYRVITALRDTGVPVARSRCLCEDESVIGTAFYVMDFVEGRVLWDPTLPGMTPAQRGAIFDEMNRVIASLHTVDVQTAGLGDFARPGSYLERQVTRWSRQYQASETTPIDAMRRLIDWLPTRIPRDAATAIVHGDLRLDNMIFHPTEPRILALLDWELWTVGDPLADFAYHMLTWYLGADEFRGMAGADLPALGIPSADNYLKRYIERSGRGVVDPQVWDFHLVFNLFRLAAILQGIAKRAQDGTASSAAAVETGRRARPIAEIAWQRAVQRLGAR